MSLHWLRYCKTRIGDTVAYFPKMNKTPLENGSVVFIAGADFMRSGRFLTKNRHCEPTMYYSIANNEIIHTKTVLTEKTKDFWNNYTEQYNTYHT